MGKKFPVQAEHFKQQRNKLKLTQADLCGIIGRTLKTYRKWEKGEERPDCDVLVQLSSLYGVSCDYLLGLIKEKTHDVKFIREYTGLSEDSIAFLSELPKWDIESKLWNNEIDYFLSNCGQDFSFYLSELAYQRKVAAQSCKSGETFSEKAYNLKLKNKLNNTLFNFLQYCDSIPDKLFDVQSILSNLEEKI